MKLYAVNDKHRVNGRQLHSKSSLIAKTVVEQTQERPRTLEFARQTIYTIYFNLQFHLLFGFACNQRRYYIL